MAERNGTTAAALAAAMFAFPATNASADDAEVAILKCVEINRVQEVEGSPEFFTINDNNQAPPQVVLFQSTFMGPDECTPMGNGDELACAPCLKELLNKHDFELKTTVVVGSTIDLFPAFYEVFSVEKYVLECEAEDGRRRR